MLKGACLVFGFISLLTLAARMNLCTVKCTLSSRRRSRQSSHTVLVVKWRYDRASTSSREKHMAQRVEASGKSTR